MIDQMVSVFMGTLAGWYYALFMLERYKKMLVPHDRPQKKRWRRVLTSVLFKIIFYLLVIIAAFLLLEYTVAKPIPLGISFMSSFIAGIWLKAGR